MEVSAPERPRILSRDFQRSSAAPALRNGPKSRFATRGYIPYLVFTLCAAIYVLPFMRLLLNSDEGTFLAGAVRILHGQVFARDFFEVMGPGTFYTLAAFFKVFGPTFLTARIWLFITSLGTGLAMYFLSRRVCEKYRMLPVLLLAGLYFNTAWPMVNHHVDSNFFALLAVVCMVFWQDTRKNVLLVAAGVLAGMTTCVLQPKGMLLLFAFLLWLWTQRRRSAMSSLWPLAGGYFCIVGLTLLYFWRHGALRHLIYMDFVWPSQNYSVLNAVPYATGIVQFWDHWTMLIHGVPWLIPFALILITPFALVAALPALVPILGIPRGKDNLKPEILLYWFCGWALWLSEFHRRDIAHLTAGSLLLIILFVYFLAEYRGKIADWLLQLLAISAVALATVNLFMVLAVHSVPTRIGTVGMFKPDAVIAFLDKHTTAGEEIFFYPYCPMYYFTTGTTNPTRFSLLIYNYNTPSQFREVIGVLDQHKVRYVVWNTNFAKKSGFYFSTSFNRPVGGFLIEPYLESHYRLVKEVDGFRIMERKAEDHAGR